MRYPHPWLAGVARLNMWLAAASLLLTIAFALHWPQATGWYAPMVVGEWSRVLPAAARVDMSKDQFAAFAALVAPPVGWMLSAWLLRAVATGRVTLSVAAHGWPLARLFTPVGLWLTTVAIGVSAWLWADPGYGGMGAFQRVGEGLTARVVFEPTFMPDTHRLGGYNMKQLVREPHTEPVNWPRRVAVVAGHEGRMLLAVVTPPAVLLCLCGIVGCVARPEPDDA